MKNIVKCAAVFGLLLTAMDISAQYYYGPPPPPDRRTKPNEAKNSDSKKGFDPTGYLTINFGIGNPLGGFATSYGNGYGNYALVGNGESITAGIPLANTNIGIALMYGFYDNPFNMNGYVTNLNIAYPGNDFYATYADDYQSQVIAAGLFYTWPIQKFSLDFRAMAGIMVCQLPEITYGAPPTSATAVVNYQWDYGASINTAFAYDIGADIRYKLRRNLCLTLNFDYTGAAMSYNTVLNYTDDNGNQYIGNVNGGMPISMFSVSLGVGYQFR